MARTGTARAFLLAVACAAAAAVPAAPRAGGTAEGPAESATEGAAERTALPPHPLRLTAISLGFADDFLGLPRTRLNDDNGFVAELRATAELSDGAGRTVRLVASEQMITERGGPARVDDGRLWVEWERAPGGARGITLAWRIGLDLVGDLGGSRMQDWSHRTVFTGRLLDGAGPGRLQDRYPGRLEVLGLAGGRIRAVQPLSGPLSLRGGLDAEVGGGTGFFAEVHPYVAVGATLGAADLELRAGAGSYWTSIRALTIPGGYVTRLFQLQPAARVVLRGPGWLPVIVGVELDWNSGNTSQHVGGLVLGARF